MALLVAAKRGHKEIVENLITNGCDICAKDNLGRTPLFRSAAQGRKEILKMILSAPKDTTEISDRYGTFPVDITAFSKEEEIALELLGKSNWMKLDNYQKLLRIAAEKGLANWSKSYWKMESSKRTPSAKKKCIASSHFQGSPRGSQAFGCGWSQRDTAVSGGEVLSTSFCSREWRYPTDKVLLGGNAQPRGTRTVDAFARPI